MTIGLFELLVRRLVDGSFRFPQGTASRQVVGGCLDVLERARGEVLSDERLADFCICQVYVISRFEEGYLRRRWSPSHSFGRKASTRFASSTPQRRYYEDRWLESEGLLRTRLAAFIRDRREHPLWGFVDPFYEEGTKKRVLNSPVGYYVCGVSTLMWNPFSGSCVECRCRERCQQRTRSRYPELYRLRCEELERRKQV